MYYLYHSHLIVKQHDSLSVALLLYCKWLLAGCFLCQAFSVGYWWFFFFYNIWHRSLAIFNKKEIIMQYTAHTTLDTSKCKYEIHSFRQLQHHQSMHQFQTAALYSGLYLVHGNWWISASSINCSLIHHCCVSVYIIYVVIHFRF